MNSTIGLGLEELGGCAAGPDRSDRLPLSLAVGLVGQAGSDGCSALFSQSSLSLKEALEEVVKAAGRQDERLCRVTAPLTAAGVLMMCLHRSLSEDDAFRRLASAPRGVMPSYPAKEPSEEAFYHARERLGAEPLRLLFEQTAQHVGWYPSFHGRVPHIIDGTYLSMPATEGNIKEFGLHKVPHGQTAYPSMKAVALVVAETHGVRNVALGHLYLGEIQAAKELVGCLGANDFLLLDRGLMSLEFAGDLCDTDVKFVGRVNGNWKPKVVKENGPGDWVVEIKVSRPVGPEKPVVMPQGVAASVPEGTTKGTKAGRKPKRVRRARTTTTYQLRLIEYTSPAGQRVRLLTNFDDVEEFPTQDIINVFPVRWEVEISFDELKTHLAATPKGTPPTILRSKTAEGARQEAYGLFAAYNLLRGTIAQAARLCRRRPTEISFTRTLRQIQLFLVVAPYIPPQHLDAVYLRLLRTIGASTLKRKRRPRRSPRVVKANRSSFPTKRAHHKTQRLHAPEIRQVDNRLYVCQDDA